MSPRLVRFLFLSIPGLFLVSAANNYDIPFPEDSLLTKESDILVWKGGANIPGMVDSALREGNHLWPNGEIPYHFQSSLPSAEKQAIIQAMQEIEQTTCVRFRPANPDEANYVLINKPNSRECKSSVGRIGGKQSLYLGEGCYTRSVILHELMHVLGFIHEQNRSDRDDYVDILWDNVKQGEENNFNKMDPSSLSPILLATGYAYDSIMHYKERDFSKDGISPTIIAKQPVTNMGGGQGLSAIDMLRINIYYECNKPRSTTSRQRQEIRWRSGDYDVFWSYGCDFAGNDIDTFYSSQEDCSTRCYHNSRCTHFTWNPEGKCSWKTITTEAAPNCAADQFVCGVKRANKLAAWIRDKTTSATFWKMDCDFRWDYGDIGSKKSSGDQCGNICRTDPECDAFTWTDYEGGTCWLKRFGEKNVEYQYEPGAVCGRIDHKADQYHNYLGEELPPVKCF